jgi:putative ABC transport system permease protein
MRMPFIFRQSLRRLTHDWRFALTTIVTLGLAIAANTVIFGAAYTVLWRPLPMANAERLLTLWNGYPGHLGKAAVAVQEYFEYRDQLETFEGLAAVRDSAVNLTGVGEPQRLNGMLVSPNLGRVLGITPAIGRDFVESDGAVGGRMVLLSHHCWRQTFGSDPHVVGQPIRLDGNAYTVAGILPAGLVFPDAASFSMPRQSDLWIAETWDRLRDDSRGNQFLRVIGLPSRDTTPQRIQQNLERIAQGFRRQYPDRYSEKIGWRPVVSPFREELVATSRPSLMLLIGAAALVLLIACANIINLMLGREAGRRKELGIKTALGASRVRLIQDFAADALILGLGAGVAAIALSSVALPALAAVAPESLPHLSEASLDLTAFGYAAALSLVVVLVVGLAPAVRMTSSDVGSLLREQMASVEQGFWRFIRPALIVGEVALACVVLTLAGLLVRTLTNLNRSDVGFVPSGLVSAQIALPSARYPRAEYSAAFYDALLRGLKEQPGVVAAAMADPLPLSGEKWSGTLRVEGREVAPGEPLPHAEYYRVSHGYFRTLGISLRAGREFQAEDDPRAPLVVIVDETFADHYWPGENPIGKRVNVGGPNSPWATVVGIAARVRRDGPRHTGEPQVYVPYFQSRIRTMNVIVRGEGNAGQAAAALRHVVSNLDAQLPVAQMVRVEELAERVTAPDRFNLLLVVAFAGCALMLAGVGLYGVITYIVTQSTREIGIRIALGSTQGALVGRLIVRAGIWTLCGVAAGLFGAAAVSRALSSLLFQVSPVDPKTFLFAAGATFVIALVSTYLPARTIIRLDPVDAIKA